jgi:MscS family membrane protein
MIEAWQLLAQLPRWAQAILVAVGSGALAWLVEVAVLGLLARLAARTQTELDDVVLSLLKRPVYLSFLLVGLGWSVLLLDLPEALTHTALSLLQSIAIILWSGSLFRIGSIFLKQVASSARATSLLQARTVPLFDILMKTLLLGGAVYLMMLAWEIDIGAWLASAGVVGVAVGFAARDSLANYFAGVFIIADAPYKLGDVILLDDGTRGRVTDIGLRSTRIHTLDDIEINIPNSILGNQKIENRTAGPSAQERISVLTSVAYGSDVDQVVRVLEGSMRQVRHLARDRRPHARFVAFGSSGLDFEVKAYLENPVRYEVARHDMHMAIYKALAAADIEIPFPKQDLYVKELPELARPAEPPP